MPNGPSKHVVTCDYMPGERPLRPAPMITFTHIDISYRSLADAADLLTVHCYDECYDTKSSQYIGRGQYRLLRGNIGFSHQNRCAIIRECEHWACADCFVPLQQGAWIGRSLVSQSASIVGLQMHLLNR